MKLVRIAEYNYIKEHLRSVRHITLNPNGPSVVRIHMVPPKNILSRAVPYILILNGHYILPIGVSWAILLSAYIDYAERAQSLDVPSYEWKNIPDSVVDEVAKVYPQMKPKHLEKELIRLLNTVASVAENGKKPEGLKPLSITDYAKHMSSPHRMDLMVSAMKKDGMWHCNQKCLHCYAAGQTCGELHELSTAEWKNVIDRLKKANIPQITFTGGEPTLRPDLVELIAYSDWFVTRLNTNGRLLTPELCKALYEASLDNVQITLYSYDPAVHNALVGANGFDETVAGIKNAVAAGLGVSVNTPLCSLNRDYTRTLYFLSSLGVKYFTCSGLIPGGGATGEKSIATRLSEKELENILEDAVSLCEAKTLELSFTSPGQVSEKFLIAHGLYDVPSCGACLSNMAIAPDGTVVPCQSWLSSEGLGNILNTSWKKIWEHPECRRIREVSAKKALYCQLREANE